jgi:hypothetical protein
MGIKMLKIFSLKTYITFFTLAVILSVPLATVSEYSFTQPTAKLMTFLLSGKTREHPLDENGLPMVYYRRLKQSFYNPVYVAVYGLAYYQLWSESNEFNYFLKYYNVDLPSGLHHKSAMEKFIASADWFVSNLKTHEYNGVSYGVWEYVFPWTIYGLTPPWTSGMAQGFGIEILIRAWRITHNDVYLNAAKLARNAFFVPTSNGGVTYKDTTDSWWYEEYASPTAKESRVFNGAAHAVIALYNMSVLTSDSTAHELFEKGLNSLKTQITKFDATWWTYYDQLGLIANYKYHYININLARYLFNISGQTEFKEAYEKWERYPSNFFVREYLRQRPSPADFTLLGLNVITVFITLVTINLMASGLLRRNPFKQTNPIGKTI